MPTRTRYQSHRRDLPDGLIIHDTVRGASWRETWVSAYFVLYIQTEMKSGASLACARPKEERLSSVYLKNKSGRRVHLPGPEENKAINAGIAADPDTRELSEVEMATLKPVRGLPVGSGKNHWFRYELILTYLIISSPRAWDGKPRSTRRGEPATRKPAGSLRRVDADRKLTSWGCG